MQYAHDTETGDLDVPVPVTGDPSIDGFVRVMCGDVRDKTKANFEKVFPANKRNGRTRVEHIKLMNFVRDEINHNTTWREGGGRPSQAATVETWRLSHPDGRKADCVRETGLSRSTVNRHWGAW